MNYLDIILLLPLMWAVYSGYKTGMIAQLATFAAIGLGLLVGYLFYEPAGAALASKFDYNPDYLTIMAFILLFILTTIFVNIITGFLEKLFSFPVLNFTNRVLGSALAVLKIGLILAIFLAAFDLINQEYGILSPETESGSIMYGPMASLASKIFTFFSSSRS